MMQEYQQSYTRLYTFYYTIHSSVEEKGGGEMTEIFLTSLTKGVKLLAF